MQEARRNRGRGCKERGSTQCVWVGMVTRRCRSVTQRRDRDAATQDQDVGMQRAGCRGGGGGGRVAGGTHDAEAKEND